MLPRPTPPAAKARRPSRTVGGASRASGFVGLRSALRGAARAAASALACLALLGNGGESIDEYQLKAAFLSKFVKYVTWPDERTTPPDAPFVVGVLGSDPFGAKLDDTFKSRKVDEHPIVVRRFGGLEGIEGAHVLFVPDREAKDLERVLALTAAAGVLLVGESDDFARAGGVVNFYVEGDKLRFEVNTDAAKRQRLKVSSDLLKVARIVTDKKG